VKKLALIIAGGAVWLLLAAAPVLADGGPHVSTINNGTQGITADSCAGCHRAHTAQAGLQLIDEVPALCLTCHGATGTGATTDVMNGVQYKLNATASQVRDSGGAILGALRGGGFANARIGTSSATRQAYLSGTATRELTGIPVLAAGAPVTSTHMNVTTPTSAKVWGNGALNSGSGGTTTLNCTSCHNPHGNGQYRILNPIPTGDNPSFVAATVAANVSDAALPAANDTRNYTVMQKKGTEGTDTTYLLYASQIVSGGYSATVGDYFHRKVPWNATSGASVDAPNGKPSTFNGQINAWCSTCHTRYLETNSTASEIASGDAIFEYRHSNTGDKPCTTCHVAHGSNALMTGVYSSTMDYPGGAAAPVGDSRLLKLDNRGTCEACHDPTGTITPGTIVGPNPGPTVP
jgi:predicted CXXCH cytochrome family protein